MSIYIGIDSGTQSTKAVALDLDTGKVVAEARAPHRLVPGLPVGHMEQHPAEWVAALDTTIGAVASQIDRTRVKGIGGFGPAAWLRAIGQEWRSDSPGETLVRYLHARGM